MMDLDSETDVLSALCPLFAFPSALKSRAAAWTSVGDTGTRPSVLRPLGPLSSICLRGDVSGCKSQTSQFDLSTP